MVILGEIVGETLSIAFQPRFRQFIWRERRYMTFIHTSYHGESRRLVVCFIVGFCSNWPRQTWNFAWILSDYLLSVKGCNFKAIPTYSKFWHFSKKPWWLVQWFFLLNNSTSSKHGDFRWDCGGDVKHRISTETSSIYMTRTKIYDFYPYQLPWRK